MVFPAQIISGDIYGQVLDTKNTKKKKKIFFFSRQFFCKKQAAAGKYTYFMMGGICLQNDPSFLSDGPSTEMLDLTIFVWSKLVYVLTLVSFVAACSVSR